MRPATGARTRVRSRFRRACSRATLEPCPRGEALVHQRCLTLVVGLGKGDILPGDFNVYAADLKIGLQILDFNLSRRDTGVALGEFQFKGNRIDHEQQIPGCDLLVLADTDFDDLSSDFRGH